MPDNLWWKCNCSISGFYSTCHLISAPLCFIQYWIYYFFYWLETAVFICSLILFFFFVFVCFAWCSFCFHLSFLWSLFFISYLFPFCSSFLKYKIVVGCSFFYVTFYYFFFTYSTWVLCFTWKKTVTSTNFCSCFKLICFCTFQLIGLNIVNIIVLFFINKVNIAHIYILYNRFLFYFLWKHELSQTFEFQIRIWLLVSLFTWNTWRGDL